jgi:hypothetical protein
LPDVHRGAGKEERAQVQMTEARRKLVKCLAKFEGIDTGLFEHEEEWELADAIFAGKFFPEDLPRLEALAEKIK